MKNSVYIATSLDGYIADNDGNIEWLETFPEINNIDTGYASFVAGIDALVIGRNTFETVLGFDIEWPYTKPVFVVSSLLKEIPKELEGKVHLVSGEVSHVLEHIHKMGFYNLYIDGGRLIQSFLKEDVIEEMIITVIPVLLGSGIPLFGQQDNQVHFKCIRTSHFLDAIVQNHFVRKES